MYGYSNRLKFRIVKFFWAIGYCFLLNSILIAFPQNVSAQNEKMANAFFSAGNYAESITVYSRLIEKEPENADFHFKLGISYLRTNIDPLAALDHLITADKLGVKEKDLGFELASAYMYHLEYEEAIAQLEKFKAEGKVTKKNVAAFEQKVANSQAASDLIRYPVEVKFTNLGEEVNSPYPDYHPFVTQDGRRVVFTSRRKVRPGSKPEFDGYFPSDIFKTEYEHGAWSEVDRLSDRINTTYDEQSVGLTASGDSLFYYIDHLEDFGDIFISTYRNSIYNNPLRLAAPINSPQVESACNMAGNGRAMVFSSNRPGGVGQLDIWITERDKSGTWSEPALIQGGVNTVSNEDFPSLSPDGNTLYFSSEGHPGMGGFDLFFSTRDTTTGLWTNPQNMGYPINTPGDERTISFFDNQQKAVCAALRNDGFGDLDIYQLSYTPTGQADDPVIFHLQISVDELLISQVEIEIRNASDEPVGHYRPNTTTGRFTLALYPGKYYVYVDCEGYAPYTEVWVINEAHQRQSNNVKLIKLDK